MTRKQLYKHLQLIHKDLTRAETRMNKISNKLGIGENHEWVERALWEVETLIKIFEGSNKTMDN